MTNIEIGERIRRLREIQKYTREGFAEKADISVKFLYEIEAGKKGFSADTLCRIAQGLSVSCDYIMYGKEMECPGKEKMICVLEGLEPGQICKMQDGLKNLGNLLQTLEAWYGDWM